MVSNGTASSNDTEWQDGSDGGSSSSSPFHAFPESKWQSLVSVVLPISLIGLVLSAILHYRLDPFLSSSRGRNCVNIGTARVKIHSAYIGVIILVYALPLALIAGSGSDDATLPFAIASTLIEAGINLFLFGRNRAHKTCTRLGSRALFVSTCVLIGACLATVRYNDIDYYGPVRVTGVELEFYRPEQKIDSIDPRYYYYYKLSQKIEWGASWGCPSAGGEQANEDKWCSSNEELYPDECQVEIKCKRTMGNKDYGECATAEQKRSARETLIACWARNARDEGLQFSDFFDGNFTRAKAPWEESPVPHTVTRSVSCSNSCDAHQTLPPDDIIDKAFWYFAVGAALVVIGCGLLLAGRKFDKSRHVFEPVPARVVLQASSLPNDLEMTTKMPIARATPV